MNTSIAPALQRRPRCAERVRDDPVLGPGSARCSGIVATLLVESSPAAYVMPIAVDVFGTVASWSLEVYLCLLLDKAII